MSFIGKQPTLNRTKYSPLAADPTNPTEGDVFYADGTSRSEGLWVYKDSTWIPVSASSGGLDVYSTEDFEANSASSFTSGNNATFLGAGAIVGTVSDETISPISKRRSLKYVQAAGSLNDYYASPAITLDDKQKDNQTYVTFYYTYNGDNNDIEFKFYDTTNTDELDNGLVLVESTTKATRKSATFHVPSSATELRFGMQVKVENIGATLIVDDIEFTTKPITQVTIQEENDYTVKVESGGTITTDDREIISGTINNPSAGTYNLTFSKIFSTPPAVFIQPIGDDRIAYPVTVTTTGLSYEIVNTADAKLNAAHSIKITNTGDDYKSPNAAVVIPTQNSINVFSSIISSAGVELSSSSEYIASIVKNGTGDYSINFVSGLFTVAPSVVATAGDADDRRYAGVFLNTSTSSTRIIIRNEAGVVLDSQFRIMLQRQGSDVRSPTFLSAIPAPKIAYVKDVKSSSTLGGDFNSGADRIRDLNQVSGRNPEIVSLSSNRFTPLAGSYEISWGAPAFDVNNHQSFLYDVTNSQEIERGTSAYADSGGNVQTRSVGEVSIITDGTIEYEIRHRCSVTKGGNGFGVASGFGDEIYTIVKIEGAITNKY